MISENFRESMFGKKGNSIRIGKEQTCKLVKDKNGFLMIHTEEMENGENIMMAS